MHQHRRHYAPAPRCHTTYQTVTSQACSPVTESACTTVTEVQTRVESQEQCLTRTQQEGDINIDGRERRTGLAV